MCTAVNFKGNDTCYFGRNLDLERGYGERVVIAPRNYKFNMRATDNLISHYAIIGMATVVKDYPLYYDGTNEKGVSMAGLNFPDNAHYKDIVSDKTNITPFELIPYILGKCANMDEVKRELKDINIVNINFSEDLPLSPLHWIIAYKEKSIVLESVEQGIKIYDNDFGVLTNNPTFDYHAMNVNNYMGLFEGAAENKMSQRLKLNNYSLGLGALGLPGDYSSASRFIRALYIKEKSPVFQSERENVNQFFHILSGVAMPKGCLLAKNGESEYTRYSSCCNTEKGIYYYNTYDEPEIKMVDMREVDLEGEELR